ncbi:hypothetical protein BU16DRAFT_91095 [Lophium mytilinum]|uniref:Inositol-pentakisphosphate 2-kinase n=1 Tax=Lophium mytilinum TaxID=390894 RepID=A0A6A6QM47_9PEZI|nr:hypothetical protein BU16DRAFT_91095 [Lophium mytilinum]
MAFYIRAATQDEIQRGGLWSIQYLGEGAANVVFALRDPSYAPQGSCECRHPVVCTTASDEDAPLSLLQNRVLRFSKNTRNAPSCRDIATHFTNITSHFFDGDTARHHTFEGVVEVTQPLIDYLNTLLRQWGMLNRRKAGCEREEIRTDDPCCILLPDLTPVPGSFATIEIKPKWLLQSPTAPPFAIRCRTCALRAQRAAKGDARRLMMDNGETPFCPLTLVSDDGSAISQIFYNRLRHLPWFETLSPIDQIGMEVLVLTYFCSGPGRALMLKLKRWQEELDPVAPPNSERMSNFGGIILSAIPPPTTEVMRERLKVAMTFRDCSMFVCVHYGAEVPFVEAYLVDLDPKVDEKISEWLEKENGLINQGWYMGKEEGESREEVCILAKQMKREVMWWL